MKMIGHRRTRVGHFVFKYRFEMSGWDAVAKFHLVAISLAKLAAYQLGKYGNGDFSKAD